MFALQVYGHELDVHSSRTTWILSDARDSPGANSWWGTFDGTCSYLLHLRFLAVRTRQCFTLLWHSPQNLIQWIHLSAQLFLCLLGMQVLCLQAFFFISKLETKVSIISSRHRPWWKATTCKHWCWPSFRCSRATVDVSLFCYARQSWCSKKQTSVCLRSYWHG